LYITIGNIWIANTTQTYYENVHSTCLDNGDNTLRLRVYLVCEVIGRYSYFYEERVNWTTTVGYSSGSEQNIGNITSDTTTKNDEWILTCLANDGTVNSSSEVNDTVTIINSPPDQVVLTYPSNGGNITNRTPTVNWTTPNDDDPGDSLTYELLIDNDNDFSSPNVDVSPVTTEYLLTTELDVDTVYYWKVRANDSDNYSIWSDIWNFTVDSYLDILLTQDSIAFGSLSIGASDNTSDDNPSPFELVNVGNILANINISATSLFSSVGLGTSAFQFKADNTTETQSFNASASAISWTNMPTGSVVLIGALNYSDSQDSAECDILVDVPADEPSGSKTSNITFTGSLT
jgi:hypothetical protein